MDKKPKFFMNFRFVAGLYVLLCIAVSLQKYFLGDEHYGNYLIFKNSFLHLVHSQNLYGSYPDLKIDLFKYTPTFALLFFPFSFLPDVVGMVLWNLLGVALFLLSVKQLVLDEKNKTYLLYFVLIEVITTLQNFQSNLLTASLMVMVFVLLERNFFWIAGICVALGLYIKLLGVLVALLWFFYPQKKSFLLSSIIAGALLLIAPLLFVSPTELIGLYQSWFNLLAGDAPHFLNHSIISVFNNCFGLALNPVPVQLAGLLFLMLPLIRRKQYQQISYRIFFLCSVLIWSVIFNHKAESATYIIAIIGAAIWFFNSDKSPDRIVMMILLFVFSSLSSTDVFPTFIKDNFFVPYSVKAIPCILIWCRIQYDLLFAGRTATGN